MSLWRYVRAVDLLIVSTHYILRKSDQIKSTDDRHWLYYRVTKCHSLCAFNHTTVFSPFLYLSLSLSFSLTLFFSVSLSLSLSHTLFFSLLLAFCLTLVPHSFCLSFSVSLSLSLSLSQGSFGAQMLGDLVVNNVLTLQFMENIADANNFSFSARYADFVGQTLKAVADLSGTFTSLFLFLSLYLFILLSISLSFSLSFFFSLFISLSYIFSLSLSLFL